MKIKSILFITCLIPCSLVGMQKNELHEIIKRGNLPHIKAYFERHPRKTFNRDDKKNTIFHVAAAMKDTSILELLFRICTHSHLKLLKTKNHQKLTPLHVAAKKNLPSNIECILFYGNKVARKTLSMQAGSNYYKKNLDLTPMHIASQKGFHKVVEAILLNGGKKAKKSLLIQKGSAPKNRTPLYHAIKRRYVEVVRAILEHGGEEGRQSLLSPCGQNRHGKDLKETALHLALKEGQVEIIKIMKKFAPKELTIAKEMKNSFGKTPVEAGLDSINKNLAKKSVTIIQDDGEKIIETTSSEEAIEADDTIEKIKTIIETITENKLSTQEKEPTEEKMAISPEMLKRATSIIDEALSIIFPKNLSLEETMIRSAKLTQAIKQSKTEDSITGIISVIQDLIAQQTSGVKLNT